MKFSKLFTFIAFVFSTLYGFAQSFSVKGTVTDKGTRKPIKKAYVHKVGSDGSDIVVRTDSLGHYEFDSSQIRPNTSYILSADASDQQYLASAEKGAITTVNVDKPKIFIKDFCLEQTDSEERWPFPLFDKGSIEITQGMKDTAVDIWIKILKDNPTIVIEADGHARKDEGSDGTKRKLSEKRAEACRQYMVSQGIEADRVYTKDWSDKTLNNSAVTFRVLRFDYKAKVAPVNK